ncbi:hypothetical protein [uncultured Tateyamaria sp.]|uniref:hypothetical protein n=1 Tax=uncultured Tateyamaria sp. TaxID=455651 RepID=UPI00262A98AC|nr:hypothetical protein [uncultured Tateyamaria sp.]
MIEFFQSLGLFGYAILAFLAVLIWNLKKLIKLRTPLDSQQHKIWRATGGTTKPDHLENRDSTTSEQNKNRGVDSAEK